MFKKSISILLSALMLISLLPISIIGSSAEGFSGGAKYVSSVFVANNVDEDTTREDALKDYDYIVDFNFNAGTGADVVYVSHNRTDNINEAITGLISLTNQGSPETVNYNGFEYKLASPINFNSGVDEGNEVFLYYTKEAGAGAPIIDILGSSNHWRNIIWGAVFDASGEISDFNSGASGTNSFMYVRREYQYGFISSVSMYSDESVDKATENLRRQKAEYIIDFDFTRKPRGAILAGTNSVIGYTRTENEAEAITGLTVVQSSSMPNTVVKDGVTYTKIAGNHFIPNDKEACIFYTKDPLAGPPIVDLEHTGIFELIDGWELLTNIDNNVANLGWKQDNVGTYLKIKRFTEEPQIYISSVGVASAPTGSGAIYQLNTLGYKFGINFDFNHDTGRNYAYIGFKRTSDINDAITGFVVQINNGCDEAIDVNGITYYLTTAVDFNKTDGEDTDYIYLYYTKDPAAGAPITAVSGNRRSDVDGWEVICRTDGVPADFNKSTGKADAFMLCQRDNSVNFVAASTTTTEETTQEPTPEQSDQTTAPSTTTDPSTTENPNQTDEANQNNYIGSVFNDNTLAVIIVVLTIIIVCVVVAVLVSKKRKNS